MKEEAPKEGEGLRQPQQTPIIPTPHTMFFHRHSPNTVNAAASSQEYMAAVQAQLSKAPGGAPSATWQAEARQAEARQAEATAVQSAETQLQQAEAEAEAYQEAIRNRHLQEEKQQAAAGNTESWEATLAKETRIKVDLEKRSAFLLGKHSNYLERETAMDMKMHETQGRLEETSELQQQVEGEKSRLLAVLVLREDADDGALLEEFDAHGLKLAEKRAELQAQQQEDLDKKMLLAQKRILVEEHLAAIGEDQEKNKAALKGLGGPPLRARVRLYT